MKKIIFSLALMGLLIPLGALADGGLIPPPNRYIYETDQKAVIFFENNTETLVISTKFQGNAESFAWIIPTPAQPQVEKSTVELFNSLNNLTSYTKGIDYGRNLYLGAGATLEAGPPPVQILETKQIEYYDIAVLKASETDALNNWLNEHGYKFPQSANYVLDQYITNGWYFTAVKISGDYLSNNLNQAIRSGDLIPLGLTFATDKIVFPLKISSVDYYYEENQVNPNIIFFKERYYPVFQYLLTKSNPNYPTAWADDYNTVFRAIDSCRLQLQEDVQLQKNYSQSVASVTNFIDEARYNEVLNIAKTYRTADFYHPGYIQSVALLVNARFYELSNDIKSVGPTFNQLPKPPTNNLRHNPYVPIVIYLIADKGYEYSDFEVQYSNFIKKDELEKLASKDNGDSWISANQKKYVLTRLYKNLRQTEMTNDIYFKVAASQPGTFGPNSAVGFYFFVIIAGVLTLGLIGTIIYIYRKH